LIRRGGEGEMRMEGLVGWTPALDGNGVSKDMSSWSCVCDQTKTGIRHAGKRKKKQKKKY
jgi:hypothetical protein